ncbi:MAG: beta-N-acetylhexosaminidase [Terriglobia bacterium]|jgi:hypothetical protein
MRKVFLIGIVLLSTGRLAGHTALLPQPQEIHYGAARLAVRGLPVYLPEPASVEDRFAAEQLAKALSNIAGTSVAVQVGEPHPHGITLHRTGGLDPLPVPGESVGPQSREAYTLNVRASGAEIRARSSAGLFYGVQTLLELVEGRGAGAIIPEVEIHDWPSLPYRGIMIDMSHGPLPTEDEVKRQMDFLARWKGNQYYFYSETSIELVGYSLLDYNARFSQEEIKRIITYARERHIDVVPCVELYGHLHDLFRIERYKDLSAIPYGSEFNPRNPRVPTTLADWIGQLAALFPSPFFHIGLDETWETRNAAIAKEASLAQLYFEQFQTVSDLVRRRGKTVLLWSDMFSKYPEMIPKIPSGTILVPWGYDATVYEPYWAPFASLSIPKIIATGVSIWNHIAPDFDVSFANTDSFLAAGRPHGILGVINTLWTDDIMVLMRPAFPGIAYGAAAAWQRDPMNRARFFSDYAQIMYYPPVATEVAAGLDAITQAQTQLSHAIGDNETLRRLWEDPMAAEHLNALLDHREDLHQARLAAEDAQEHFSQALEQGGDRVTLEDLLLEARMLDYSGMKGLYAVGLSDFWQQLGSNPKQADVQFYLSGEMSNHDHSHLGDLVDALSDLREGYREAWTDAYTPYRLGTMLVRFDAEIQRWYNLQRRLSHFPQTFRDGDTLPSLQSVCAEGQ